MRTAGPGEVRTVYVIVRRTVEVHCTMSADRGRARPNRHGRPGRRARRSGRVASRAAAGAPPRCRATRSPQIALAIADAEGIDAVSIRRIARELRSGAMSLYHYFDSRDELLELMADRIAAEMVVPELPDRLARGAEGDRPPEPRRLRPPPVAPHHAAGAHARDAEPDAPHRAVGPGGAPAGEGGYDGSCSP